MVSFGSRSAAWVSVVGAAVLAGTAWTGWWAARALSERVALERLVREAALVERLVSGTPAEQLASVLDAVQSRCGARVTLLAEDGRIISDSAVPVGTLEPLEPLRDAPEIERARLYGEGTWRGRSRLTGEVTLVAAYRSASAPAGIRYVRLALPRSALGRSPWDYASLGLAAATLAVALAVGTFAWRVRRELLKPLARLQSGVEAALSRVEPPELDGASAGPELGRLARAIEGLGRALRAQAKRAQEEWQLLARVVAGVREGLLVVGADGRVLLANAAAREILEIPVEPEGRRLAEVVRQRAILEDVERAAREGCRVEESTVRSPEGRVFALRATPLSTPAEEPAAVLVLLLDVTRLEALERVRRDFVADVSHELRTPLTSIRAFVETLLEDRELDPARQREFLEIVHRHVQRMQFLIEELTDLSRIETGAVTLEIRELDARAVAAEVLRQLTPQAQARQVTLALELPEPLTLRADPRRLEQILTNLVDNAVKFNRPGGHVWVRGSRTAGGARLVVEDDGVGIPSDQLERIFHRFHRVGGVAPQGSRGTGLGLAIVKHLMRLHGGRVDVESELGRGSRFILDFPRGPAA